MSKQSRVRFSISSILWLTLFVGIFLAGRMSVEPKLQRALAESAHARAIAEMEAMRAHEQAAMAQNLAQQRSAGKADDVKRRNASSHIEDASIVTYVPDGDTLKILRNREEIWIRLHGIDCPESDQAFGPAAQEFTHDFCFGREVEIVKQGTDGYDRVLADLKVDGVSLSESLLKAGLAWHLPLYDNDPSRKQLAAEARASATGLWSEKNPIPPVDWRKRKR